MKFCGSASIHDICGTASIQGDLNMKIRIFPVAVLLLLCLLCSCTVGDIGAEDVSDMISPSPMETIADTDSDDWEGYEIISLHYSKRDVEIDYPYITNLADIEKQNRINEILILTALDWAKWWLDDEFARIIDEDFDKPFNLMLDVEYDILFQSDKYLCVNYAGMYFTNRSAYPIHLFYTVNIDMSTGRKLALSDIVNIDSALVSTVRDYFRLYIDNDVRNTVKFSNEIMQGPESAFILEQELEEFNDERFMRYFESVDSETNIDSFFYFTKDVFGFTFPIQFYAGCHYEIEIKREDIEKHIILKDLFD